jgi:RNA-directed DNA polymerase
MATASGSIDAWQTVPWPHHERAVFKLQTRIYRAARRGDTKTVHRLQRLLLHTRAARWLAVRRVSQDNRGKRTAGVDGVHSLTPRQRQRLAQTLRLTEDAAPLRRVWIPKPGTAEQRPLGIPTLADRAAQALAKLALEPEWEARFEPNSYGFRPGRSAHDAIAAIWDGLRWQPKYVLDADLTKCFDRINHAALLARLHTTRPLRRAIRAWLQAGVLDGSTLFPTVAGTPQGGVVSPLLANIALHGLETTLRATCPATRFHQRWQPIVVRYADDFVVLHPDLAVIQQVAERATAWLAPLGLELHPQKTRIVHTLQAHAGQPPGFDFLGFRVRQYPVGRTHTGCKRGRGGPKIPLGFKTRTTPSAAAMRRHFDALRTIVHRDRAVPQAVLIGHLAPVIRGWSRYYRTASATASFARLDYLTYHQLRRWAHRRHSTKAGRWVVAKYWRRERGTWDFAPPQGRKLPRHRETAIQRHIKVQGSRSPFDGDWIYWGSRLGRQPAIPQRTATLLHRQQGRCARCGLYLREGDVLEIDHIQPTARGGPDTYANWHLLHGHCHDAKTAADTRRTGGTLDHGPRVEEPDEVKVSRPVLEPGGGGDPVAQVNR